MGEVRVRVRLTNAIDEALARRGRLGPEQVRSYVAEALVDTGAVRAVVPPHVVERLGLAIRGQRVTEYADGCKDVVGVTEPLIIEVLDRDTLDEALVVGDEVIIGQTILEKLDLLVDCVGHRVIPNPAHPDQPVSKLKRLAAGSSVGRGGAEPRPPRRPWAAGAPGRTCGLRRPAPSLPSPG